MTFDEKSASRQYLENVLVNKDGTIIPLKLVHKVPKKAISQRQREPSPSIFEESDHELLPGAHLKESRDARERENVGLDR